MHRTLKAEATQPGACSTLWRSRPGSTSGARSSTKSGRAEALGLKTPGSFYEPSPRLYPAELPEPVYPPNFETRRVNQSGYILFERHKFYLGWCLPKEVVGLEELEGDKVDCLLRPACPRRHRCHERQAQPAAGAFS